jgi:catechol 2,3-dioxygenase-like lactoylglutathione lyase family enzyme
MMPRRLPKGIENMNIERLDHLVLTVVDIARTSEFYTRVLGMEVVRFGEGRTALRFGQQKINLHPADNIPGLVADKPTPGSGDLCFITKVPLAEVTAHLEECGVPVVAGPGPRAGAHGHHPVGLHPRSRPKSRGNFELLTRADRSTQPLIHRPKRRGSGSIDTAVGRSPVPTH